MNFTSPSGILGLGEAILQYRQANDIRMPQLDAEWDALANTVSAELKSSGWVCKDEYQWVWERSNLEGEDDDAATE